MTPAIIDFLHSDVRNPHDTHYKLSLVSSTHPTLANRVRTDASGASPQATAARRQARHWTRLKRQVDQRQTKQARTPASSLQVDFFHSEVRKLSDTSASSLSSRQVTPALMVRQQSASDGGTNRLVHSDVRNCHDAHWHHLSISSLRRMCKR